jgi:hypothetical protein
MGEIIKENLEKWTEGLEPLDARISVFEHIRDIPYKVIPELRSRDTGPRKILELMCGSCTPKHFLLGAMFEMMDVPIKYVSFPYSWDQKHVDYPDELREWARLIPTEYHLACSVRIGEEWVLVDATWDPPLAKAGFPVNESWDGISDTKVAVDYLDMIVHEKAAERDEYVTRQKSSWTEGDYALTSRFIDGLNTWLQEIRKS